MTIDEQVKLITKNVDETLTEGELRELLEKNPNPKHYIGFEISGKLHLGQGLFTMMVIKNFQDAGVDTSILLADWHTWLNKKLDGTLPTARKMAREYFEEAFKAAALCVGADLDKLKFVLGSELYEELNSEYWATVVNVSKATTMARMLRSTTIMGRKETEISDSAMLIYPAMQSADIFCMDIDIAHAGSDQRNVHIVARDAAKDLGKKKPVALHHHLLMGLGKPSEEVLQASAEDSEKVGTGVGSTGLSAEEKLALIEGMKMSKSKPDTAVFIHDEPEDIKRKVSQAYAPEGVVQFNPILDWCKYLIFFNEGTTFTIDRPEKWGGALSYDSYEALEKAYIAKELHPMDLKNAVAEWLIQILEPARKYFEDPKRKAALEEIERLTVKK